MTRPTPRIPLAPLASLLLLGCSPDDPEPVPAGTLAHYATDCATSDDCIDGVCVDLLGAPTCVPPCDGAGSAATCPADLPGSCSADDQGVVGCEPGCEDGPCPTGLECADRGTEKVCAPPSAPHFDSCAVGLTRCGDACVRITDDPAHCGGCDKACPLGGTCQQAGCVCPVAAPTDCSGVCVSTETDEEHCGQCNTPCTLPNASTSCNLGECTLLSCAAGFLSCDGDATNGCETAGDDVPAAVIDIQEGTAVEELVTLHLSAAASTAPDGEIATYQWTVVQPAGSQGAFEPDATSVEPTFLADLVGSYSFGLVVTDELGAQNCAPANAVVAVGPQALFHVELFWTGGGDLDVHLAHQDAGEDPWYHETLDCWAGNPTPQWGKADQDKDDPVLEQGADAAPGVEILALRLPQAEHVYRLAVHHASGDGPASASIRVHVNELLSYQLNDLEIPPGGLWDVGRLEEEDAFFGATLDDLGEPVVIDDFPAP